MNIWTRFSSNANPILSESAVPAAKAESSDSRFVTKSVQELAKATLLDSPNLLPRFPLQFHGHKAYRTIWLQFQEIVCFDNFKLKFEKRGELIPISSIFWRSHPAEFSVVNIGLRIRYFERKAADLAHR